MFRWLPPLIATLARTSTTVHAMALHGGRGPTYRGGGGGRGGDGGAQAGRWTGGGGGQRGGGRGGGGGRSSYNGRRARAPPTEYRTDSYSENSDFVENADWDIGGDMEDEFGDADFLYGVSPVLTALRCQRRSFDALYLQETMGLDTKGKSKADLREIDKLAEELGIEILRRDKGTLNGMCRNRPHQGLVLRASPLEYTPMQALPDPKVAVDGQPPLWLALDEVTDPQNMGALLRSAFFLGADGVLVSQKNSCSLTPTVSKASAGAMELMEVHAARNLPRTLEAAREAGWAVVGAALEKSVEPSELDAAKPTVLVLGSEGHGLRTNVLRACSDLVRIPRGAATASANGDGEMVDSLNVSVAGGILLYALLTRRVAAATR